jgi:hypothetical protein
MYSLLSRGLGRNEHEHNFFLVLSPRNSKAGKIIEIKI